MQIRLSLPRNAHAPAVAREAVRRLAGLLPAEMIADLQLVASELVTGALLDAWEFIAPTLELSVSDHGATLAVRGSSTPQDDPRSGGFPLSARTGLGLQVVDALASRWWAVREPPAGVVCEFDRAG